MTIQEGIDVAVDGDTVLVENGTYYENLIIDKSIILTSRAIFDDLDEWLIFSSVWYEFLIDNDNILGTIIDGSSNTNQDAASTILITGGAPTILGFTIQGGYGTLQYVEFNYQLAEKRIGGGIFINEAEPRINYNHIHSNGFTESSLAYLGGGIGIANSEGDLMDFSFNVYSNNNASNGKALGSSEGYQGDIDMSDSVFEVYNCAEGVVLCTWVIFGEETTVDFENSEGNLCAMTNPLYYLDNDQSISEFLEFVDACDNSPLTIVLSEGVYSPSTTGTTFPIKLGPNITLIGQGAGLTILDAEQTGQVLVLENGYNNTISNLTITGGTVLDGDRNVDCSQQMAGGMTTKSSADIDVGQDAILRSRYGFSSRSDQFFHNLVIADNECGALYIQDSNPVGHNIAFGNNTNERDSDDSSGYQVVFDDSQAALINSIFWGDEACDRGNPILELGEHGNDISFSNIKCGWNGTGTGNIEYDPMFNNDYTLMQGSLSIDAGDSLVWFNDDVDDRNDQGAFGGQLGQNPIIPNIISHHFSYVTPIGASVEFTVIGAEIEWVDLKSPAFSTSIFNNIVTIECLYNPNEAHYVSDTMYVYGEGIWDGAFIPISADFAQELVLAGDLSGTLPAGNYVVTGDIVISLGEILILQPGTNFVFFGDYIFEVFGTLIAEGTEQDNIRFDGNGWKGLHLEQAGPATIFKHVQITGALGSGMSLYASDPILEHVSIYENSKYGSGSGMYLHHSNPTLTNVTITDNLATTSGGGMYLLHSNPTLTNVTIANNTAEYGGGMVVSTSNPILTNSIIWGNSPESIYILSGTPLITYSDIEAENTWTDEGNINSDPLFTEDYILQAGSPCINAGTIIEDMEYCGDAPDMGAYEYCEEECGAELADVSGDGIINVLDLVQVVNLILELSTPAYPCAADYNQDGQVNILDVVLIANYILNP